MFLQCHIKGYTTCVCLSPFQHLHCLFKTCFKQNKLKIGQSDILKPNANNSNGSHQTPDPMGTRGLWIWTDEFYKGLTQAQQG